MAARIVFRITSGAVMAPMFLLSVGVQYNDPDPVVWIAIYFAAFVVAVQAARERTEWRFAAAVAAVAGVWAFTLIPDAVAFLGSDREPVAFFMKTGDSLEENARECGGLLLVFLWSTIVSVTARFAPRALAPTSGNA